jgi:hypothetical protein
MTRSIFLLLTLSSILFLADTSYCQVGKGSNEELALKHAREIYSERLSEQSGIYRGIDYIGYPHRTKKGDPFFLSDAVRMGEIRYDGMLYKNVPMWYDLARKEVIVGYFDGFSKISLHSEKISDFLIENHHFINIQGDTASKHGLDEGFYDQIYKGKSEILVKRDKNFLISTDPDGLWMSFSGEQNDIFLKTGEKYESVSSQKSVLKALGKYEKEIQAHLKKNKVKFNKQREKAIMMMVAYYDQLNKQV